jgi:hypothetical protein
MCKQLHVSSYVAIEHVSNFLNAAKGDFCLRTIDLGGIEDG